MFLKRLFYASASILMLAAAYHLGATRAMAQQGSMISGFAISTTTNENFLVMTPNGDVYASNYVGYAGPGTPPSGFSLPQRIGNFWSGGTVPADGQTWGSLKARYR